jgi:hypothetical protein
VTTEWTLVSTSTASALLDASGRDSARIEIHGALSGMPMVRLATGVHLRGGELRFGAKGLQLTRDNVIEGVRVRTAEHEPAILNDLTVETLAQSC